ncbi:MAG: amidohydrolase family protein [Chloroflexi bacterium]|nr:amidohydrolase family protein [Chloroflexota bacterium]MBT4513706.1 amidohydrolase family protein [Chloroflexota bacterium]MBT6682719.1 amidohydrolase family protein [Chloroflexota bacterium]
MKAIVGGNLIDGTGAAPVLDTTVLVDGESIVEVGPRASVSVPPGAEVIDASGMTVMPGMIDCHDHLSEMHYDIMTRWRMAMPNSLQHLRTAKIMEDTLAGGFTCIRDGWGLDAGFKMAVEEGLYPGPRLMLTITFMSGTGGHADRVTLSGHQNPFNNDPRLPDGVVDGPDAARAKVREIWRAGADVIKFATTGGGASRPGHGPFDPSFGRDEVAAIVAEASEKGLRTMCHALAGDGLRYAVEEGAGSIEHGGYLVEQPDLLKMMADNDQFYVPTFAVYEYHAENSPPHMAERARALKDVHQRSLHAAMEAGVKVAAGTDMGGFVHGKNYREIEILVERGMTPLQAIKAATGTAAECVGLGDQIGTLEVGKLADVVIVDGDMSKNVSLLGDRDNIKMVMKGGDPFVDKL